jgi:ABC-2 type transport system permease protein
MRLALAYAKAEIVALLRYPTYAVSLIAGPSVVFYLVGVPLAFGHANRVMASFLAYALLGIVFFQFGISVALDRTSPWESFLRTLPVTPGVRFAGRALSALPFAASAALGIVVIACAGTSVDLSAYASSRLAAALLLGCLPFVLLGLALGYWLNPKAAAPVANMVYLVLVLGGRLWVIPRLLPHPVASSRRSYRHDSGPSSYGPPSTAGAGRLRRGSRSPATQSCSGRSRPGGT